MKVIGKTQTKFLVEMDLTEITKVTGLSVDDAQVIGNEVSIQGRYDKYIGTESLDLALAKTRTKLVDAIDNIDKSRAALTK